MPGWTQTSHGFTPQTETVPISGASGTLSGSSPFLRFTDTDAGEQDYRIIVDASKFDIDWLSGTSPDVWTNLLRFTDPSGAAATLFVNISKHGLKLQDLSSAATKYALVVLVSGEANERFRINSSGKIEWGAGGGSAPDVDLSRTGVGIVQIAGTIRGTVAPSNIADLTRKSYVDAQDLLKVSKAGDTMTGALTLPGNPTAPLEAATKQYVDSIAPTGGALPLAGGTMTGTITFDFALSGTIFQSKIASEANPRFKSNSAGLLQWGPGGASAVDVDLGRVSANVLGMLTAGDAFVFQAGTEALPGLAVYGDLNTGIRSSAADTLEIITAGADRWQVTSAGHLLAADDATYNFGAVAGSRAAIIFAATAITVGDSAAAAGSIRLPNAANASWRNAAGGADIVGIKVDASDRVALAPGGGDILWGKALVALGGGAPPTLGTIGGSGPTVAGQNSWMRVIDSTGAAFWVPVWV